VCVVFAVCNVCWFCCMLIHCCTFRAIMRAAAHVCSCGKLLCELVSVTLFVADCIVSVRTMCSCWSPILRSSRWHVLWMLVIYFIITSLISKTCQQWSVKCWPDCKPEEPLFSAEFICWPYCKNWKALIFTHVCLCVSDRHFYPSTLTDFDETWSQGPYSDLV